MGELWRSEPMQLVQLFVQIEAARDTVDELGNLGLIQFRDLNPDVNAFQRNFVNEVKRFDEMERKVRFFEEQVNKANIDRRVLSSVHIDPVDSGLSSKVMIDELEAKFDELEKDLIQMNSNQETLDRNANELVELQHVLEKDQFFFDENDIQRAERDETQLGGRGAMDDERSPLVAEGKQPKAVNLGFVTGVILREKLSAFERVLWRATRGNMFMKQAEIETPIKDPHTGDHVEKNVFIIFFQGDRAQAKIKKICESFGANLYPCPDTAQARRELRAQVNGRIEDLQVVLRRTSEHNQGVLQKVAANIDNWKTQVLKEKSIYHTMNLFNYDVGRKCLIAEGWCPTTATDDIQRALRRATDRSGAIVPSILSVIRSNDTPPTYFKTNKFTESFQAIVESYGVARYMEVNPTVFTIVTFPFLFGVMFGDLGHGVFMAAFAFYLIFKEKELSSGPMNEMVRTCFDGRYLIFLMGLFGMYAGLIYNEFFAMSLEIFKSNWQGPNTADGEGELSWNPNGTPYLFGVDPGWKDAGNDLTYYNSLKMKLSIILGVCQMLLGICISALNAIHFKKPYNFFFEFLPQMVFMLAIFGYMVFLVFLKWFTDWRTLRASEACKTPETYAYACEAPSILNLMIQMFLSPLSKANTYRMFPGQLGVQVTLILLAIVSVPFMLFPKPFLLKRDHQQKIARQGYQPVVEEVGHDEHGGEFDFSEILVHQVIHTIEFVLGAVSNTASYLRLWALSLAHAELSKVFLQMVLVQTLAFKTSSFLQVVLVFCGFAVWAALTFGVLLMMESLSAFLHALRLHWVEFQNKFYQGDGYKFAPFSYQTVLAGDQ